MNAISTRSPRDSRDFDRESARSSLDGNRHSFQRETHSRYPPLQANSQTNYNEEEEDEASKSLLTNLIPHPTHSRAKWRTLSTIILALFFILFGFQAVTYKEIDLVQQEQQEKGIGWTNLHGVEFGEGGDSQNGELSAAAADADNNDVSTHIIDVTPTPISNFSALPSVFSETKSSRVKNLLESGNLSNYAWHDTLSSAIYNSSTLSPERRLIIVGDIHGMHRPLSNLLTRLGFDPGHDTLLHTGDIVGKAKSSLDSVETVRLLSRFGAKGVRGNHDQGILEWRKFLEAYGKLDFTVSRGQTKPEPAEKPLTGEEEDEFDDGNDEIDAIRPKKRIIGRQANADSLSSLPLPTAPLPISPTSFPPFGDTADSGALQGPVWEWLSVNQAALSSLGVRIPDDWEWAGDWFNVAKDLGEKQVEYLEKLPLSLYLQGLDSFIVHAGMLPAETEEFSVTFPSETENSTAERINSNSLTRFEPSESMQSFVHPLLTVTPNTEPFTLQNMRTVKGGKRGEPYRVSKRTKGTAWHKVWSKVMENKRSTGDETINLVYGHWAGQGLETKQFSFGLDSGCVYGRRLSALVLPLVDNQQAMAPLAFSKAENFETDETDFEQQEIQFGPHRAWIVSVTCAQ